MKKFLYLLMVLAVLAFAGFISTFQQGQTAQAELLNDSAVSIDAADVEKDGTYYVLTKATDTNDGSRLTLGDKESSIFTTDATLSKWNGEASLKVNLPPAESKSFTWNTAVKIPASVTRVDGKLVVNPEKLVYPYDDNTDLIMYELPPDAQNEGGAFEYELKLYSMPKSNIFTFNIETENLVFYYQPPLTEKQIAEGNIQPDNVAGSYAVYHATKANNEYKTGKAFHIYRPKVTDANGNSVWADLNIDSKAGVMTITVDQKFLDLAAYPIMVDPTFGYTSSGGSQLGVEGFFRAGYYASGGAGVVTLVSGWFTSNGDNVRSVSGALYDSSYGLVTQAIESHTCPVAATQLDFTLTLANISNTNYFIVAWGDTGTYTQSIRYDAGAGTGFNKSYTTSWYTFPSTITGQTNDTNKYSIWATYVQIPTVTQTTATNINKTSVTLNGEVTDAGGGTISTRGFDYDTDSGSPYTYNWHEHGSWGAATFNSVSDITGLTAGTLYYYRAYGINEGGTGYSTEGNFTTLPDVPLVVTDGVTDLLTTTVTLKGNITSVQGDNADTYGFEWDIDTGAPYALSWTSGAGSYGIGAYSRGISSLSAGTEYFWRFIATNSAGQGNSTEAKLLTPPVKPSSLVDGVKTDVAITYAWNNGSGAQKTMVRYSDSAYPTSISDGTQAYFGNLTTCDITSLDPNTLYYVSAWSYTTLDGLEEYSTDYATDTAYTRPSDVSSIDAHDPDVDSIDLEWSSTTGADKYMVRSSTAGYPTSPSDGSQTYFSTGLVTTHTPLQPNKQYFYVVYGYGNSSGLYSTNPAQDTETTLVDIPVVTNSMGATGLGKTYATLNGNVDYAGGDDPTCKFYWGESDGGEDAGAWTNEELMGVQSGLFSKPLAGLSEGMTYYYRTYGINSAGVDWADSTSSFTAGVLNPTSLTANKINDYQIDLSWVSAMPINRITMGIDNPPTNPLNGTFVYWGNATSTSYYTDTTGVTGNMTFRLWADGTTFYPIAFAFSDNYVEDSVILTASGGGSGDMTKAEYDTNDDGIVNEADYAALAGNSTYSITSGNSTYSITAGDADTLDTHHWSEIPSAGDMFKSTYDTNDDGVVDEADFAALAGDSDTLDGHHWVEIPGGGGNVTFVTDAGNVTGTLFYLLGSGTISTSGSGDTIIINGTTFLSLPDTPDSYVGQGGKYVAVNGNETAVVFVDTPPGGNVTSAFSHVSLPGGYLISASGEDTLYLQGTDIIFEAGDSGDSIEASIGGDNVDTLASNSTVALALGIPFLLGLIGAWRHSLTGYIAGILGLSIALGILQNDIGLSITIPVIVVILGLGLALVRDAWTQGVEIF